MIGSGWSRATCWMPACSAAAIEASDLDYTIIRPAWLSDDDEIAYGTTVKGETFANAGACVSRKSVADLIVKLVTNPTFGVQQSIGVHAAWLR